MSDENSRKRDALIDMLASLWESRGLEGLAVSATFEPDSALGPVKHTTAKLLTSIRKNELPRIGVFAVSKQQNDLLQDTAGVQSYRNGTEPVRLIACDDFASLVESLVSLRRGRAGVKPIDYARVLNTYQLEDFVGRKWLTDAIQAVMSRRSSGYIVLVAGPGFGKSAFLLKLISDYQVQPMGRALLGGWHFLRRTQADFTSIKVLVEQLEWQLRDRLKVPLERAEAARKIDEETTPAGIKAAAIILRRAIRDAVDRLQSTANEGAPAASPQLLLLIDGVDEAFGPNATGEQLHLLPDLFPIPAELPPGVFVLFTSRPGQHLRRWIGDPAQVEIIDIDDRQSVALRGHHEADIRRYLEERIVVLAADAGIAQQDARALTDQMVEACEGAFAVAKWFVDRAGPTSGGNWLERWIGGEPLPRGIDEMYKQDWIIKNTGLTESSRGVMAVLATAIALWHESGTPVSGELINDLLVSAGKDPDAPPVGEIAASELTQGTVTQCIKRLRDWFDAGAEATPRIYTFRHSRIPELLLRDVAPAISLISNLVSDVHRLLTRSCARWASLSGTSRSAALGHFAWHAAHCDLHLAMELLVDARNPYLQAAWDDHVARPMLCRAYRAARALALEVVVAETSSANEKEAAKLAADVLLDFRRTLIAILPESALPGHSLIPILQKQLAGAWPGTVYQRWIDEAADSYAKPWLRILNPPPPTHSEVIVCRGTPGISHVFSPSGQHVAGACGNSISIWQTEDGQEIGRLHGHGSPIQRIAFSPNGRLLASCGRYGKRYRLSTGYEVDIAYGRVILWDFLTGRELARTDDLEFLGTQIKFSHDGRWLASWGADSTLRLWEILNGNSLRLVDLQTRKIDEFIEEYALRDQHGGLAFDFGQAKEKGGDGILKLAHRHTTLYDVRQVEFSSDNKRIVGGCRKKIEFWNIESGLFSFNAIWSINSKINESGETRSLKFGESPILIRFALPEGSHQCVSVWDDKNVQVNNAESGELIEVQRVISSEPVVEDALICPNGRKVLSSCWRPWSDYVSGNFELTDFDKREYGPCFVVADGSYTAKITDIKLSPSGQWAVCVTEPSRAARKASAASYRLEIFDIETGEQRWLLPVNSERVETFAFSPDERVFAVVQEGGLTLFSLDHGNAESRIQTTLAKRTYFAQSNDKRCIATFVPNRAGGFSAQIWNTKNSDLSIDLLCQGIEEIYALKFSPSEGKYLACGTSRFVRIWDARNGEHQHDLQYAAPENQNVSLDSCTFSDEGDLLVGYGPQRLKIWDVQNGASLLAVSGPEVRTIEGFAFSPGRNWFAAYSHSILLVWNLASKAHYRESIPGEIQSLVWAEDEPSLTVVSLFVVDGTGLRRLHVRICNAD